jgi:hypothetical protein
MIAKRAGMGYKTVNLWEEATMRMRMVNVLLASPFIALMEKYADISNDKDNSDDDHASDPAELKESAPDPEANKSD